MASPAPRVSFVKRFQIPLFYLLAFALSWLVWGSEIAQQRGLLSFHLPDTLAYWGLTLAVVIMASLAGGKAALWDLARRIVRWRVGVQWYAVALLVPIALALVPAVIYRLFGGAVPLGAKLPLSAALVYLVTFTGISLLTEELAWRGFALTRLQARYSTLTASLIVGVLWGLWHTPLFLIAGSGQSTWPYLGFILFAIAESVLITWLYNHANGSVLLVSLFHAAADAMLAFSGVLYGSQLLFWLAVAVTWVVAIIVVLVEGPARLARGQRAEQTAPARQEQAAKAGAQV